ncbi:MAG: hypothetical protein C7B43_21610 [Sulfobacillus benefaciens]|uniref:Uncharacterized protein n=1 Tax=Sulfobacillus benefaciens TaxID=453960 RepID=A0A2T2WFB4_9FIRM|nr:MAG: hypothetical protein C7B43_21610 [Sulfobacillus benefaciens]
MTTIERVAVGGIGLVLVILGHTLMTDALTTQHKNGVLRAIYSLNHAMLCEAIFCYFCQLRGGLWGLRDSCGYSS